MSHSLRLKTKARREARTDVSAAASEARCTENVPVKSNETVDQNAKAIEMSIDDIADEDSESNAGTTSLSMQRPGQSEKQPLRRTSQRADGRRESWGGVVSSIEDNTDSIGSTMEWRRMVLQSQEENRVRQNREGRWRIKMDAEIQRIRQHYHQQEKVLEREIAALEQKYECTIAQLEKEGQDEEPYFVDRWEAQSDYQPTECGEGSRSLRAVVGQSCTSSPQITEES